MHAMGQTIFSQPDIIAAIQNIVRRNEQMVDLEHVALSFYDDHVVSQLININNQSIQGRRGTGKTHLLRMIEATLQRTNECVVYIDCRMLGSAGTIQSNDKKYQAMHLFRDFVDIVVHRLKNHFSMDNPIFANAGNSQFFLEIQQQIEKINSACTEYFVSDFEIVQPREDTDYKVENMPSADTGGRFSFGFGSGKNVGREKCEKRQESFKGNETIVFPDISKNVEQLTKLSRARIYLLIDEWSSIHYESQPIFAEFLKRCFLCCPYVTAKISFVSHRTKFINKSKSGSLGIELSAELPCKVDLDEIFVFDKNPGRVVKFMGNLLIRHIQAFTGRTDVQLADIASGFENSAFTQLVRASEGNARDFINILDMCISQFFFDPDRTCVISSLDIINAAEKWFYAEKYASLSDYGQEYFNDLLEYVVFDQHTRGCFIDESELTNPNIGELIDARALHIVSKGHIYSGYKKKMALIVLDYGAYCGQLKLGDSLKLFRHDKWEKLCDTTNGLRVAYARKYWQYDDKREVVACVKKTLSVEIGNK